MSRKRSERSEPSPAESAPSRAWLDAGIDDSTRRRLLQAAVDVFAERGFSGATTREVCSRAGVNSAGLNYHWRSKEQLWQSVCERCGAWFVAIIAKANLSGPLPELISEIMGRIFDEAVLEPRPLRVVMWASLQAGALDYDASARLFRPIVDFTNGFLVQQQSEGKLPAGVDVEAVVPLVQGQLIYLLVNRPGLVRYFGKDFDDPAQAKRFRDAMIRSSLLLLGLEPPLAPPAKLTPKPKKPGRKKPQ